MIGIPQLGKVPLTLEWQHTTYVFYVGYTFGTLAFGCRRHCNLICKKCNKGAAVILLLQADNAAIFYLLFHYLFFSLYFILYARDLYFMYEINVSYHH